MLTIQGTLISLEERDWTMKDGKKAVTVTANVQQHGYVDRVEIDYRLDRELVSRYVGKFISGPVRVFRKYDEESRRLSVRLVLMGIDPDSRALAA